MKSVMVHDFGRAPAPDIQRSSFDMSNGHKTTIDFDYLYPITHFEVLPSDTFNVKPTIFARLNTPLYPTMDNMEISLHWFFVPYRLLWSNWRKFMGEQVDPGDSIDYTIPQLTMTATTGQTYSTGAEILADHLGMPYGVPDVSVSVLPFRAYNLIYDEWFRDQNLIDSKGTPLTDTVAALSDNLYQIQKRGKKHDYFTSCLPWLQKGDGMAAYANGVSIPLGTSAPLSGNAVVQGNGQVMKLAAGAQTATPETVSTDGSSLLQVTSSTSNLYAPDGNDLGFQAALGHGSSTGYADLSTATAATINQLRQAFQIQKLLERDARSGTRYAEIVKSHFGATFQDVTYRPEYLGGGRAPISIQQVANTSEDATQKQGDLTGYGLATMQNGGFTKSFNEHGVVMGIISASADLTYQQGVDRSFLRSTRFDFYWPSLAHIGEQAVTTLELFASDPATDTGSTGTADNDRVFGYAERYSEYKFKKSEISGKFRSANSATLDPWHLSQEFAGGASLPTLGKTFIESTTPIDRVVAVTSEPDLIVDAYFNVRAARPMPLYGTPGMIDHF